MGFLGCGATALCPVKAAGFCSAKADTGRLSAAEVTDGRFSGGPHGFVIGHVTPEAFDGGPIAVIKNGDAIVIDAEKRAITLDIGAKELDARLRQWKQPKPTTAAACSPSTPPWSAARAKAR